MGVPTNTREIGCQKEVLYTKLHISNDLIKDLSPPVAYFIIQTNDRRRKKGGRKKGGRNDFDTIFFFDPRKLHQQHNTICRYDYAHHFDSVLSII